MAYHLHRQLNIAKMRSCFSLLPATTFGHHDFMSKTYSHRKCSSKTMASDRMREENVVIVGAGIAGLATSLALRRLGIKSLVLEKAGSLRTGGTSLSLSKNAWRVLDDLGVSSSLRQKYNEVQGIQIQIPSGRVLKNFSFRSEDGSPEIRAVERSALLECLSKDLPTDTILFKSNIMSFETMQNGKVKLVLDDDTQIVTKALIGCDGIHSTIAKSMGFKEPRYLGYCALRGLGVFSNGQPFEPKVHYIYGKGVRAVYVPMSSDKVYWFIGYNTPSPGPNIINPSILKEQALQLVKGWPQDLLEVVEKTPDEYLVRSPIADRWLWPFISPKPVSGCVTVAGDAWHPMSPDLGQGACSALEDSVVLSRGVARAFGVGKQKHDISKDNSRDEILQTKISSAFKKYTDERRRRMFPLQIKAFAVGAFLQSDNGLVCNIRDNIIVPKVAKLNALFKHTEYDCGSLFDSS